MTFCAACRKLKINTASAFKPSKPSKPCHLVNGQDFFIHHVLSSQPIDKRIGQEVSFTGLCGQLGLNKNTVDRHLDFLEKAFVVYKLRKFSRNLRKEVSRNPRYYFYDSGIRNALIQNFNSFAVICSGFVLLREVFGV